jgi:O-antigen/teichoic acid export membrane protein
MADPEQAATEYSEGGTARTGSSAVAILAATAVVGVAGYVITWLVPRVIGVGPYASFAIFWAAMFLVTAALTGVQQEITRATRWKTRTELAAPARTSPAVRFAVFGGLITLALVLVSAAFWVHAVFPSHGWPLVLPLAIGAACYLLLAVLGGTLYGTAIWGSVFWLILVEGVLRLILIGATLAVTHNVVPLAWAVIAPFPVTVAVVGLASRRRLSGRTRLDVPLRALSWNVVRTVVAASSMGLLISGFPLLLGLTARGASADALGLLILTATLTRAPLIVVGMALQSFFVYHFQHARNFRRVLITLLGAALALGAVLAPVAGLIGPWVFRFLFPGETAPSGWLIGCLVGSSALLAGVCVTAPAALSRNLHTVFTAGWVIAAIVTIICLLLPLELEQRTIVALFVGPLLGLCVHLVGVLRRHPHGA